MQFINLFIIQILCISQTLGISESQYAKTYNRTVKYFAKQGEISSFFGKNGIRINYWSYIQIPNTVGCLVISPGRGNPLSMYHELANDIKDLGLSIYIIDHRGQGNSGRMVSNPQIQHVDKFTDYEEDLETFFNLVIDKKGYKKNFLLGDSMGGFISTLFASRNPKLTALILTAPMFGVVTAPLPNVVARYIAQSRIVIGKGMDYLPGAKHGNWHMPEVNDHRLTTSDVRFRFRQELFQNNIATQIGGVSCRWLVSVLDTTHAFLFGKNGWKVVVTPTLLLQSESELIVSNAAQARACQTRFEDCEIFKLKNSLHGVWIESDLVRDIALDKVKTFIKRFLIKDC